MNLCYKIWRWPTGQVDFCKISVHDYDESFFRNEE